MPLKFNTTNTPSSVQFNGTNLRTLKYNGTTVWQAAVSSPTIGTVTTTYNSATFNVTNTSLYTVNLKITVNGHQQTKEAGPVGSGTATQSFTFNNALHGLTSNVEYTISAYSTSGDFSSGVVTQNFTTDIEYTEKPDILTLNQTDITYNSATWYIRNNDSNEATIYSRLSNDASYQSVANVQSGLTAQFNRTDLLDKHTYTIQAYAITTDKLQSDNAIEEQFTTDPIYYSVKWYDGYDAAPYFSQTVEKGDTVNDIGAPTTPEEISVGYEFDYWEVNSSQAIFPYTINTNTNFIAKWKVVTYTVLWKDWESTTLKTQIVGSNYYLTTSDEPAVSRTGWMFIGWSPTLPFYVNANKTLTAQYSINSYTLKWYDADGVAMKTQSVQYGDAVTTADQPSPLPTKDGYTFTGWQPTLPFYMPANNVNMTPTFSANTYTITWKNWDGSVLKTQSLQSGYYITSSDAPTASRTGYTFSGWSPTIPRYVTSSDIIFTAQFTINSYAVKWYDGAGAVLWSGNLNYGTYIDSAYIDPGSVSCKYFTGWSPSLPHTITAAVNFIPQYSYYNYTVTWYNGYNANIKTQSYQCGATCASGDYPDNPTRTGYTFAGWNKASGFAVYQNWTISATWTINTYYVRWYGYEGNQIKAVPYTYGSTCPTTDWPANPTYSCKVFSSWSQSKVNFTVTENVSITSNWTNLTPGVPGSYTASKSFSGALYASWAAVTCATSYNFEYKRSTSSTWITVSRTVTNSGTISGLVAGGTYNTRVRACNNGTCGSYSTQINVIV